MRDGLTLGIIGVGNLGGALAEGALAADAVARVIATDVATERLTELSGRLGERFVVEDSELRAAGADVVVAAVKPHLLQEVAEQACSGLRDGGVFVSVAAGVRVAQIESALPDGWPVVRAMPNLAMLVRESATALCTNPSVQPSQLETVESIFQSVGTTVRVDESQMHAVTGLSGSGPAYVSLLIEGLADGAVKKGLRPDLARSMACQLLFGTAKLLREGDLHPAELRERVTTPGGTTIAGLQELEALAVRGALMAAVEAAAVRSEELARER